ncbi:MULTISPECIES: ATP synthase F1 subunit delta [Candidatus Ichthyocystis]|uniref:ATP synthase subunit delta n=1 Tax=Candidatus Ichthyocystis hellenicum TaxID=1561003 RepID=A0A0S4LZY4_9BURK|nr:MULTISPECIES: ATP synthase F1 subunit delta [Ichthyocystis]CUT17129.1 ATP synthase subunit delta [Candidatus Ichthyocystis hellenicum]
MRNNFTLARPYARAAFSIADEDGSLDLWLTFFDAVCGVFQDLTDFHKVTRSGRDNALLWDSLSGVFCERQVFFLKLLLSRDRFFCFPAISSIFKKMVCDKRRVIPIVVESSFDVSSEDRSRIGSFLEKMVSSEVIASFETNSSLIGGCVVHVSDDCYDASVLGRLEKLAVQLGI